MKETAAISAQKIIPKPDSSVAWAPGHVTGFFKICDEPEDILHKGSIGAGLSLEKGCTTQVTIEENSPTPVKVLINNTIDPAAVSYKVIDLFFRQINRDIPQGLVVKHNIEIPFGAGFGSSGAGALSLALALNAMYNSPLSDTETGQIAHTAEAESQTGLGTVLGDTVGGLEIRTDAGAPGIGKVLSFIQLPETTLFACVFGPYQTKSALSNPEIRQNILSAFGNSMNALLSDAVIENFMDISRQFAEKTKLISVNAGEVLNLFDEQNIPATMTMFGDVAYTIADISLQKRILDIFSHVTIPHTLFESRIAEKGAHVIDEH